MTTDDVMMGDFAWEGSRLTTTSEAKLTKIRRKNLSASASNSLRGCMARFAADSTLPRMDDPFSPAELGTGAHEVLENLYDLPGPQRTKENLERISLELADKMWDAEKLARHTVSTNSVNGEVKREWEERVRAMALGDFVLEDPTQVDVFQPEWALKGIQLAVPDGRLIPMIGFIDRTDFTPEGKLSIRDYKTGKYKAPNPRFADDYGDQLRIYTVTAKTVLRDPELRAEHFTEEQLARLEATGHYDVADARLLYTAAGKEREIIIEKNALDTTMAGFARSWDAMNNAADKGEFTTTPGPLCGWCPLANSCPSAKVTTDKARAAAAGQPSAVELGIPTIRPGAVTPQPGANAPRSAGNVVESKGNETRDDAPHQAQREANMSTIIPNTTNYAEDSAWKPEINSPAGKQPNLNSYGFGGATGITSLAYEILAEKKAVSSQRIDALATTLSKLLWGVERRLTNGAFDWNHGLHTRLRGHLRTFIDNHPVPLNGTEDQWKAWLTKASEDITDMLIVAYKLIELDLSTDVQPYAHLAKDGVKKDGGALGRSFLPAGIVYSEAPVYEESVLYPDGARPNINCHGFAGVCGVVSAAYTRLHKDANATYTQTNLIALAATYGRVLWLAQTQLVGTFKWGHGLNGRLRGFLFDILDNSAPTVNQTVAEWEKWVAEKAVSQLTYLGSTSYNLYSTDFASVSAPFAALSKAAE